MLSQSIKDFNRSRLVETAVDRFFSGTEEWVSVGKFDFISKKVCYHDDNYDIVFAVLNSDKTLEVFPSLVRDDDNDLFMEIMEQFRKREPEITIETNLEAMSG